MIHLYDGARHARREESQLESAGLYTVERDLTIIVTDIYYLLSFFIEYLGILERRLFKLETVGISFLYI